MPKVARMHFVCRDDLNVSDLGDGIFETGIWKVSAKHAASVDVVALHQSRSDRSYRQGRVVGRRSEVYQGAPRFVFVVQSLDESLEWEGKGAGEKGYGWANQ